MILNNFKLFKLIKFLNYLNKLKKKIKKKDIIKSKEKLVMKFLFQIYL